MDPCTKRSPTAASPSLIALVGGLAAALSSGCVDPAADQLTAVELTAVDSAAVRALEETYVSAWVANDRNAVLATIREDAVLLPDGLAPVEGLDAIEAFWWPTEGPTTTVTAYRTTIDELGGSGSVAYARGEGHLSFTWEDAEGGSGERTSRSVFLMVARKNADGEWRIANRMWHSLPE